MDETLRILDSVHSFYSHSFDQLMVVTIAVLTFAGVAMPILISLYQKKLLKIEQEEVKALLKADLEKHMQEAISSMKTEFDSAILALEIKHEKQSAKSHGAILHVQGGVYLSQNNFVSAFERFTGAGYFYIKADSEANLKRVITQMKICLGSLNKDQIEHVEDVLKSYNDFMESVEVFNTNDRYTDDIYSIKAAYKTAMSRA